jgi:O-methyltransferase
MEKGEVEKEYKELLKRSLMGCVSDWSLNEIGVGKKDGYKKVAQWLFQKVLPKSVKIVRISKGKEGMRESGSDSTLNCYTLVGYKRLDFLENALLSISKEEVEGDILEAGVWRGGASIYIKKLLDMLGQDRVLYCADSFEGMPKPKLSQDLKSGDGDYSEVEFYSVKLERVIENFKLFNALDDKVHFIKGWFSDTMPTLSENIQKISLLRIDCDLYESTNCVLSSLYPKVSSGGFIYIDDYNSWAGCKQAVDDFRRNQKIDTPLIQVDWSSVFWRKKDQ